MSVSDGEKVNAAVTNAAFVSRTTDSNTTGVLALDNVSSGGTISNAQQQINDNEATGTTNAGNIASNTANIATNTADIATNASDIANKIDTSEKGAVNGVATLDGSGRMPSAQLPTSATEYKGAWNASTNTPTLIDGTGTNGDLYRVSVAGSQDLGSGSIAFGVGDALIYNGTIWERIPADDAVTSVNTQTGVVVLDTDDISEGVNKYANGSIDTHSDVDTTSVAPTDGQVLTWVDANSAWENKAPAGGGTSGDDTGLIANASIAASVAAGALTIELKQKDGSTDPTALAPATVAMRSSTLTSGAINLREVTSALSLVVPVGATLGHGSGEDEYIYVYVLDNAGTLELAISSVYKDTAILHSTIAMTDNADDSGLFSTTARASVPIRLISRMRSNQVVTGTWALVPSEIVMVTPDLDIVPEDRISTSGNPNTAIGANVAFTDEFSFILGPGKYKMSGTNVYTNTATVGLDTRVAIVISDTAGDSLANTTTGINYNVSNFYVGGTANRLETVYIVDYEVTVTDSTTFYYKYRNTGSTSITFANYALDVRRLKL